MAAFWDHAPDPDEGVQARGIHELHSGHVDHELPRIPVDYLGHAVGEGADADDVDVALDRYGHFVIVPSVTDLHGRFLIRRHRPTLPSPVAAANKAARKANVIAGRSRYTLRERGPGTGTGPS